MSSAHASVQAPARAHIPHRYWFVFATFTAPGSSGSHGFLIAGTPVMDKAPSVVPW